MSKYHGAWSNNADLKQDYPLAPDDDQIVFASYETPPYEGYAMVVFKQDGKWFESNDSHCSCNGLEGWNPEETTPEAILARPEDGYMSLAGSHQAIREELERSK